MDGRADALEWLVRAERREIDSAAPELVWAEVAQVLRRHVQAGRLQEADAAEILLRLLALPIADRRLRPLTPAAAQLASERGLSVDDAYYLALAEAWKATLVTADRRLAAAAHDVAFLT